MLHIVQNDPEVPPGTVAEYLDLTGILYCVHHPYCGDPLPDVRDVTALIVMGGAMGANDERRHPFLYDLKIFIRQVVAAGVPYLGICLGGQMLAAALGGRVVSGRWEELGCLQVSLTEEGRHDPLFSAMPEGFATFQWHHDSFDIPEGGVLLASSTDCPNQAFRFGSAAWGIQFHPEVTERIIRDWCAWDPATSARADEMLAEFGCIAEAYHAAGRKLLEVFLRSAGFCHESCSCKQ
jgi:GMP synthase-like glutamine amidotransferase